MAQTTINPVERILTATAGGALLAHGLRAQGLSKVAETTAGAALLARSVSPPGPPRGEGPVAQRLGISSAGGDGGAPADDAPETQRSLTIDAPAPELYDRFRSGQDLPEIWGHIAEITPGRGDGESHWTVRGPLGRTWAWDTHLVAERDGHMLRWASVEGADLASEGTLELHTAPRDLGTGVTLRVRFEPPGGAVGQALADRLDVVPRGFLGTALRRWKALVETGEIPTTGDNPSAR